MHINLTCLWAQKLYYIPWHFYFNHFNLTFCFTRTMGHIIEVLIFFFLTLIFKLLYWSISNHAHIAKAIRGIKIYYIETIFSNILEYLNMETWSIRFVWNFNEHIAYFFISIFLFSRQTCVPKFATLNHTTLLILGWCRRTIHAVT